MKKADNKGKPENRTSFLHRMKLGLRPKLIIIFLFENIIPIVLLAIIALNQIASLGHSLRDIAVKDSSQALNKNATEAIERITTDAAANVARFLRERDNDIVSLAAEEPAGDFVYENFIKSKQRMMVKAGTWKLAEDGQSWKRTDAPDVLSEGGVSSNSENDGAWSYREPDAFFEYDAIPLYDEVTYIDLSGMEIYKATAPNSPKNAAGVPEYSKLKIAKQDISVKANTYVGAETYWAEIQKFPAKKPDGYNAYSSVGEKNIYVSDVTGAYVGSNYIGMYAPEVFLSEKQKIMNQNHPNLASLRTLANKSRAEFAEGAAAQAYAGEENPNGQRFQGIIRWARAVYDGAGDKIGYVTLALNHDHIMEMVDHTTPMNERYTNLPSAFEGNYAFIWDYKCRSIAHPRHHSIVGFNPLTGDPQVPWLEGTNLLERNYGTENVVYEGRTYKTGEFIKEYVRDDKGKIVKDDDGNNTLRTITVPGADGKAQLAKDTPYYYWSTNGGAEWLAANPSWNSLSAGTAGSWGMFLKDNIDKKEILPQFGERVLKDKDGNPVKDKDGKTVLDYQSRDKTPAGALTKAGFVGLDGRYLNNAPQCTGWMDITEKGGSGSFLILWSGHWKLTTAAAIPYYTGHYSPEDNRGSKRGFGFVAVGADIDAFSAAAAEMEGKLSGAIARSTRNTTATILAITAAITALLVIIGILVAASITGNIEGLVKGISRFRAGERQYRFNSAARDEFGTLADSFDEMADSIVASVANPLCITDMDQKIIYMNEAGLRLRNLTPDEAVGRHYGETSVYPIDSPQYPITALEDGREAEVFHVMETDRYIKGIANHLYDKDGKKVGYIIETVDVTEMSKTQAALEKAVIEANVANSHKGDFLARMSHEIRTPMNAIIGLTGIVLKRAEELKKDAAAAEIKAKLHQIEASSQHLLGLLNDILDISKIEAGKIELSEEAADVAEIGNTVSGIIKPRCDDKNIVFKPAFDSFEPYKFMCDALRLRQVLINLLGNAVKFTPECGTIEFSIKKLGRREGETLIGFYVKDTGIGIPKEAIDTIFKPFEQANKQVTAQYGGTGLGLSISRSIIRMLGGDIKIESEVGKGSTFSFELWLKETETGEGRAADITDIKDMFAGKRALLVDDVEINRMIVISMLEETGLAIDEADDGLTAIEAFEKSAVGGYDIILMDIKMTHLDGYEASKRIRALGRKDSAAVPIIALTANAFKDDIDAAIASGMNGHIAKPIEEAVLFKTLFKFLGKK